MVTIFKQDQCKLKEDVESRISDTFQTLGELSIENENYPQAIEDLETCLRRREKEMPGDSRCIAETYYQLGVAQGFNLQFDAAVISLEGAIQVLQKRVDNLKTKTESIGELVHACNNDLVKFSVGTQNLNRRIMIYAIIFFQIQIMFEMHFITGRTKSRRLNP